MRRAVFKYYRRIAVIKLKLSLRLISVEVAGWLVKLAFWICPQLEKTMRELWGRDYARNQLTEIEESYESFKLHAGMGFHADE
jgi:hypothetical protein